MPPALFVALGASAALAAALSSFTVSIALSLIVGAIGRLFIKKPKTQPLGFDDRTLTVSNAIQPRQYFYGENRVGGTVVFLNRSLDDADVWLVIALAGWQIEAIGDTYINNTQ